MTAAVQLTPALQDYLETIFLLVQQSRVARVRDIAKARDVKAGSVSPALKRLAEAGLVDYAQREFITLTPEGEAEARRVLSRHRILTRFFHEVLLLSAPDADAQACAMEHSLSDDAMDRLVRLFEYLDMCPGSPQGFLAGFHGCIAHHETSAAPEPGCAQRGCTAAVDERGVDELEPGERGRVTHVHAHGPIRQRLLDMGLLPDVEVSVERVGPGGSPLWIRLDGSQLALRQEEANAVRVRAGEASHA